MKLAKNTFQILDHIAIWPVISLIIFFLFFIGLLWWVFTVDKTYIQKMKNTPLQENKLDTSTI